MTAYISSLNRLVEATQQTSLSVPDLEQRFVEWYATLPEISRCRPFAMIELEQALSTQGKYLGHVLLTLGWERKRRWTGHGQYSRYWIPPYTGSGG